MKARSRRTPHTLALVAGLALTACGHRARSTLLSAPPAAAADNDIYVAEEGGTIRALRPDGTEQWSYALADDLERLSHRPSHDIQIVTLAARSGSKLYGLATRLSGGQAGESILFALDSNRLVWQRGVPYPTPEAVPLAVGQDALYESGNDGLLYAYARADGRPLWQYQVSSGPIGAPTVGGDGTIYVTGPRQNLHAVAPDGTQRWVSGAQP